MVQTSATRSKTSRRSRSHFEYILQRRVWCEMHHAQTACTSEKRHLLQSLRRATESKRWWGGHTRGESRYMGGWRHVTEKIDVFIVIIPLNYHTFHTHCIFKINQHLVTIAELTVTQWHHPTINPRSTRGHIGACMSIYFSSTPLGVELVGE